MKFRALKSCGIALLPVRCAPAYFIEKGEDRNETPLTLQNYNYFSPLRRDPLYTRKPFDIDESGCQDVNCMDTKNEYHAAWRNANRERLREYQTMYRKKNRDNIRKRESLYYKNNCKKILERVAKYWKINPHKKQAANRAYEARKRLVTIGDLTEIAKVYERRDWWRQWFNVDVDHINPLARGGSHEVSNMQIIYSSENRTKGDRLDYKPKVVFR